MKQLLDIYSLGLVFLYLFWYALFQLVKKRFRTMLDIIGFTLLGLCLVIPYIGDYLPL